MITSRVYHETLKHLLEGNYEIKDDVPVETELIHQTYGSQPAILKGILEENTPNPLDIVDAARIRENSDEIEMVLETVPRPEDLGHMIDTVKGVKTLEDLGLDDSMRELSAKISPYVRKRLTFMAKKNVEDKKRLIPHKALFRAAMIWETWVQTCYNYERMMGMACGHTFLPVVKYLYPDNKEKQIDVMTREMEFFNVHPEFGSCILGLAISLEEDKAMSSFSGKRRTRPALSTVRELSRRV